MLGSPSPRGQEEARSDLGATFGKRLSEGKEASMNFHVREDSEIKTPAQMNGAIHVGGVWVGRGWGLKDLPDFVKALHCSCSVCLTALAKPLPWQGGTCEASSLARGCSLTAPLVITTSAFLYNLIPADFAFFTDILPNLLASGLLSLNPSLDSQAQGSTPPH